MTEKLQRAALRDRLRLPSDILRTTGIAAGVGCAIAFVVIGLGFGLEMYADGSIFSYSVAVRDAWAFHWHNISGRLLVYVLCYLPAEAWVELTGNPRQGVAVYGFLFFAAPLLGLLATFAADRSKGRTIFGYACLSTACLCPLVFGFPTETWAAHALFWPALAVCHDARRGARAAALVFVSLLALAFTHAGALIFAVAILATLLLRGARDAAFRRAAGAFLVVVAIWVAVKATLHPDAYDADVLARAARHVLDPAILTGDLMLLLLGAIAGYLVAVLALGRLLRADADLCAAAMVASALAVHWLWFDHALHADNRYYLRTVILVVTPVFGALAAMSALRADGELSLPAALARPLTAALASERTARAATGMILLVMLIHSVETAKFVGAWTRYRSAVQSLAMGTSSDPALGDARFVSAARIGVDLNRLSWSSTTHFLSVLVAPGLAPARLVVDPTAGYFWLTCAIATANEQARRAVPRESRRLVRVHACLHR